MSNKAEVNYRRVYFDRRCEDLVEFCPGADHIILPERKEWAGSVRELADYIADLGAAFDHIVKFPEQAQ